jgi:hypothetical protein
MTTRKQLNQAIVTARREIDRGRSQFPLDDAFPVYTRSAEGRQLEGHIRTELRVTRTDDVIGWGHKTVIKDAEVVVIGERLTPTGPEVVFTRKGIPVIRGGVIEKRRRAIRDHFITIPEIPGPEESINREIVAAAQALRGRGHSGERI